LTEFHSSRDPQRLKPFTALVTGSSRGIGAAIAAYLAESGVNVLTTSLRPGPKPMFSSKHWSVDLSDDTAFERFLDEVSQLDIDILVNNAGINRIGPVTDIDIADFDQILKVNLRAPFLLMQRTMPNMIKKGWGRIVNIGSIFSTISKAHRAPYSASKFGLDGLTAAVAAEVAHHGVLVNTVSPGFIETDLTREVLRDEGMQAMRSAIPLGRLGQPAEIGAFVGWLVSPENTYVSGQNLLIDGGFSRV
jgi:NAD(P)-dependent dehydrogenase (short-subunit alcohol dehydrogenase family)